MRNDIQLSYIFPVYFNQKDTNVLNDLLEWYSDYNKEILSKIEFVIVDDGSPIEVAIPDHIKINYRLLRVQEDKRWNQAGARNLGVVYSSGPRIILTDCDHVFPEALLRRIISSNIPRRTLYKFRREDSNKNKRSSPWNILYTSKSVFFSSLGYDEEFCGNYGYEDVMFRNLNKRIGNRIRYLTRRERVISTSIDRDNSYHSLTRDTAVNKALLEKKMEAMKTGDPFSCHSRLFLNFSYKKVGERWVT